MPRITKKTWTAEQDLILTSNYANTTNANLAIAIGKTESAITARAFILKLFKSKEFHLEHSKLGWYKKGDIPANKDKKLKDYLSTETIQKIKATQFKKGREPHNTKHDGFERISKDGYVEIRIRKGVFKHKHRVEWEKVNGLIPSGHIIVCRSNDLTNCNPENWEMITRKENAIRNASHDNPSDNRIAAYIATTSKKLDRELQSIVLHHPEIIDTKRTQLILNRKIKQHGTEQNSRPK